MRAHKKRISLLVALAFIAAALAGPTLTAGGAPEATLTGKLVLKGSAPLTYPVLIKEDGSQWRLYGAPAQVAAELQSQTVTVLGAPGPAGPDAALPGFTVSQFKR